MYISYANDKKQTPMRNKRSTIDFMMYSRLQDISVYNNVPY